MESNIPPIASVWLLEKANGENAQVSFVPECQCWLVSSKNVSLLLRTTEDLAQYSGERYEYALMIGRAWLEKVLPAAGPQNLEAIKAMFSTHTAVGEYCGHPSLEHLVRYSQETIYFYALVSKNGNSDACLPPKAALESLTQIGLPVVKISHQVAGIKTLQELGNAVAKLGQMIAVDPISVSGEGGVLYLQKEGYGLAPRVVGLGKLKTMEYRILRKLREKLKGGIDHANDNRTEEINKVVKKFMKEIRDLARECSFTGTALSEDDGLDLAGYESMSQRAFKILGALRVDGEHLHNQYNSFLDLVNLCVAEKREPNPQEIATFRAAKKQGKTEDPRY